MKKIGMELKTNNEAIQGPRGLSIKEVKFKQTLSNGDNVYQVILEDNSIIGELTSKKGDKGDKGEVGNDGRGIVSVVYDKTQDNARYYKITYTDNTTSDFFVENGDSAYEIAVTNGFEGTEEEWLESLIGKGLEFNWNGTQLGVRVEGEEEYQYVDLKGDRGKNLEFNWNGTQLGVRQEGQNDYQYQNLQGSKGNDGKNLEFTWRGTELGVRVQGQSEYQYVDLKGEQGDAGSLDTSGTYDNMTTGKSKLLVDRGKITAEITPNHIAGDYGLSMQRVYNNGYPESYGNVINLKGVGEGQLLIGWSGATGENANNYIRSMRDQGNTWSEWAKIYTDKNLSVYTKSEIDTKFKNLNLVPVPVGGVLLMWNNSNPAELYAGTTWELITAGKYIQSGSTALQTGGSNSITIQKANLPNIKLKIDSFNLTTQPHFHTIEGRFGHGTTEWDKICTSCDNTYNQGKTNEGGGQNTGTASPYTENLGNGQAINIQPAYITLKFWKRLT